MGRRIRAVLDRPTERTERPADERGLTARRRVPAEKIATPVPVPGARVSKEIHLPRTPERVWKALTDKSEISRWLLPVSGDITQSVGHRFAFTTPDGGRIACEVVDACRSRRLAYTWQTTPDAPHTLVTLTLTPTEAGTRLTLEHENGATVGGLLGLRACLGMQWKRSFHERRPRRTANTHRRQRMNGETNPCLWYQWSWKRCPSGSGLTTFTPVC